MIPPLGVSTPATRLGWLDVLRGWAALAVALHHATYVYLPDVRISLQGWFDPGTYGVLVFFLVSGYIVPASLERRESVRGFWIGRFFRIYPLLAVASFLAVLPFLLGVLGLRAGLEHYHPVTAVLAHMTMMQDLLAVPNAMNVLWTLSYEMAFYLLVVALFVVRAHRRSAPLSVGIAAAALAVGGLLQPWLLSGLLSRKAGVGVVVAAGSVALVVAVAAAMSRRPGARLAGGLLGGLLAAVLVTLNGRVDAWQGLAMMALMFAGTAVYRAEHGQIPRWSGGAAAVLVPAGALAAGVWNMHGYWHAQLVWAGTVVTATATFAGAWLLRHRRFPRWATSLGAMSFSVYLLHPLLLMVSAQFLDRSGREDVPGLLVFVAVLLAAGWASQRWIEAPGQRMGRRLARRAPSKAAEPPVLVS
ncbi:acyltransferase family protein [Actinomadura napierensis]|uniref:Acyltransferase 3 domain-containing protein n=1 Tax=Actinomadura napierensis TaxID=267854 RepID=A0ABN2Y8P1_9ACTN